MTPLERGQSAKAHRQKRVKTELFFHLLVSLLANPSWLDGGRQGAQLTAPPPEKNIGRIS